MAPGESLQSILIPITVGVTFMLLGLYVDDRIVRFVCRREGKRYLPLWFFDPYWQLRVSKLSWYGEARSANLLREKVVIAVSFFVSMMAMLIKWRLSAA